MSSVTVLRDDIDGTDATETVSFGLDGAAYEIDLSDGNATKLRAALAPYVKVARKAGKPTTARPDSDAPAIRAWANDNGVHVAPKGRIPADVAERYAARDKVAAPSPDAGTGEATPQPQTAVPAPVKTTRNRRVKASTSK